jgi:hypothetical protein
MLPPMGKQAWKCRMCGYGRYDRVTAQRPNGHVPDIDRQISNLEGLVQSGQLDASRAAPALEKPQSQRRAMLDAAKRGSKPAAGAVLMTKAEEEDVFRETVADLRAALEGDDPNAAREALRSLMGGVKLAPGPGHLMATFTSPPSAMYTGVYGLVAGHARRCTTVQGQGRIAQS